MTSETVVLTLLGILLTIIGFFLMKFFTKTDEWSTILTNLDKMVSIISVRVETLGTTTTTNSKDIARLQKVVNRLEKELESLRNALEFCQTKNPSCPLRGKEDCP